MYFVFPNEFEFQKFKCKGIVGKHQCPLAALSHKFRLINLSCKEKKKQIEKQHVYFLVLYVLSSIAELILVKTHCELLSSTHPINYQISKHIFKSLFEQCN